VVKTWYKHIGDVGDFSPDFHTPTHKDLADLEVELLAQDPAVLNAAADAVKARIAGYPGIAAIADSRKLGKPEIRFRLKPEGERLGLRLEDLAEQVRNAYEGEEAQRFMRGRSEVKIQVRHPRAERQSIDDLLALPMRVPNGGQAPLGALAEIGFGPGYGGLSRADRQGVVKLEVQLVDPPPQSPEAISKDLETNLYPDLERRYPGVEISRGEAAEEADEIMAGLKRNTLIALAVIYALLAVSFRSYAQPFLFLLAVPVAWLGGVLAHWALGLNISFQSLVGMVAASGVVVNDSVVLLDYIRKRRTRYEAGDRRLEVGKSPADRDLQPPASSLLPDSRGLQRPLPADFSRVLDQPGRLLPDVVRNQRTGQVPGPRDRLADRGALVRDGGDPGPGPGLLRRGRGSAAEGPVPEARGRSLIPCFDGAAVVMPMHTLLPWIRPEWNELPGAELGGRLPLSPSAIANRPRVLFSAPPPTGGCDILPQLLSVN
jgi:hypothetical protein